jgi:hypothetical protein
MKRNLTCISVALLLGLGVPVQATVTGQWDFNNSNLVATVGTELAYRGDTESVTTFTTTTIGGSNAVVMKFPAATSTQGYTMTHGMAPNGGGSYVNQWTFIMDLMFTSDTTNKYHALLQSNVGNSNDADLWVNGTWGIGAGSYYGYLAPDVWHRVGFVVDASSATSANNSIRMFIDGAFVGAKTGITHDGTYGLDPTALLFTDNDGETTVGYVNSIQIHDVNLSDSDLFALGGPSASGIPAAIPVLNTVTVTVSPTNQNNTVGMTGNHFTAVAVGSGTLTYQWYHNGVVAPGQTTAILRLTNVQPSDAGSYRIVVNNGLQSVTSAPPAVLTVNPARPAFVTGQWDFNQGDLRATVGQPLQYFDTVVQTDTSFSSTTSLGLPDIGGQPANVMFCNPSTARVTNWCGFVMTHGIGPNGGGTNVNQYTVILDLCYPNWTSGFYRALWQTNPQGTNDADAFINGNNGIGISQQYDGVLGLDTWHRVVLAFDLTKREFGKYVDGTNICTQAVGAAPLGPNDVQYLSASTVPADGGGVDMRWSLGPTALLLADEDGEVQPVYVSSVQVRSGRMTDADVAALGAPTGKIPQVPTAIQARRSGTGVTIDWNGTVLEGSSQVTGGWSEITGAQHPYVVTSPTGARFFRVKQ